MPRAAKTAKILPLTTLRFFAALYVVAFHLRATLWSSGNTDGFLNRFLSLGYISVSFFFCLSGFVLAVAYLPAGPVPIKRFFVARLARLYPLIVASMLLDLPNLLRARRHLPHAKPGEFLAILGNSFALLAAWFPTFPTLNFPVWSVSVEVFFYLLFPWVAPWLWRRRASTLGLVSPATYVVGTLLLLRSLPLATAATAVLAYNPLFHIYEFLLGICLARLFLLLQENAARERRVVRSCAAFLLCAATLFLYVLRFDFALTRFTMSQVLLQHGVLLPLYACLILVVSLGDSAISRALSWGPMVILGEASFGLYLLHGPLMEALYLPLIKYPVAGPIGYGLVCIGLSVASFLWFERPARRMILNYFHTRSRETEAISSIAQ